MSKIINTEEQNKYVVVKTEGYFNKDLGELVISVVEEKVQENKFHFILDLEQSKIVNSIGASILIGLSRYFKIKMELYLYAIWLP